MNALKRYSKAPGGDLSEVTRVAMEQEVRRQTAEYDAKNAEEIDAMVLWVLHEKFGFGEERLHKFYEEFRASMLELLDRFKYIKEEDQLWLCTYELKKAGIDISTWKINDK